MRESFIAQYLEEQRRLKVESAVKSMTRKREVEQWRKNHSPKRQKSKPKQERRRKQKPVKDGDSLAGIIESLLGPKKITRHTSFKCALKLLGFVSYAAYLKSPLWRAVKSRVFKINGDKCFLCENKAFTVHHRKYTGPTLIGEHLEYLSPICNGCHKTIEFDVDGRKLASDDVEEYVQEHLRLNELQVDDVSKEFRSMFL